MKPQEILSCYDEEQEWSDFPLVWQYFLYCKRRKVKEHGGLGEGASRWEICLLLTSVSSVNFGVSLSHTEIVCEDGTKRRYEIANQIRRQQLWWENILDLAGSVD